MFAGKFPHPRCSWMQSELQHIEELIRYHQFTIADKARDWQRARGLRDLRKVPAEGSLPTGLQVYLKMVAEQEAAKAIIFGLQQPPSPVGQCADRFRLHRFQCSGHFKRHLTSHLRESCRHLSVLFVPHVGADGRINMQVGYEPGQAPRPMITANNSLTTCAE
jgi:hypothetical protein